MYLYACRLFFYCLKPPLVDQAEFSRVHVTACDDRSTPHGRCVHPCPKRARLSGKTSPFYAALLDDLGREDDDANQLVYLGTVSRVLPGASVAGKYRDIQKLEKADLLTMVRGAIDEPIPLGSAGRRPRTRMGSPVDLAVVSKSPTRMAAETSILWSSCCGTCASGSSTQTLAERHKLPSHWSCSHSKLWSAISYLCRRTSKKPVVDPDPAVWTYDGRPLDLKELSREPFVAEAWRKRGERLEDKASAEAKKAPAFTKLDFVALVLSKHLHTKASLMAYVQQFASAAAQEYTSKHQRRLQEFLEDAQEWAEAKAMAHSEKLTDWEIVCRAADTPCKHAPGECGYATAVQEIFRHNASTLSPHRLATSLRKVLVGGPSKTCRVPFLVGPSNTGKSTLLYTFDDLFGPKHVFHKPALGSTFALRNIVKSRRFIFWDDYRPVEYAHKETVPVATFLSLFIGKDTEVQVSQSFNDGNLDVKWSRGVVFTAKEQGLWDPTTKVSAEDVHHVRNRVEEFRFSAVVPSLKDVESCAPCMARWIRKFSEETPPAQHRRCHSFPLRRVAFQVCQVFQTR